MERKTYVLGFIASWPISSKFKVSTFSRLWKLCKILFRISIDSRFPRKKAAYDKEKRIWNFHESQTKTTKDKKVLMNLNCTMTFFGLCWHQSWKQTTINHKTSSNKKGKSWVFLLRRLWIFNYDIKSSSNNLSNENIKTAVSVVSRQNLN